MAQVKILLDTNTYLRLAQSIHPLLGIPFGENNFTLYIHSEIETELNRNSRLQNKFYWSENEEYRENRKKRLNIAKQLQKEIENTYEHIWEFQKDENFGLSREDIYCISTSLELEITLVTDDQAMVRVCKEFGVEVISTLGLMNIMVANSHIKLDHVKQIIEYWKYENDLPANFKNEFNRLFGHTI